MEFMNDLLTSNELPYAQLNSSKYLIFLLVGRGQSARNFSRIYCPYFPKYKIITLEPEKEWYPIPNGIDDQFDSILGIKTNVPKLFKRIKKIRKNLNILRKNTIIAGFSAGAVMMLELIGYSQKPFNCAICHNGAILDVNQFPDCKNNTPILLIHSEDDDCFEWNERYLPMKQCLKDKKYNLTTIEKKHGGHDISYWDMDLSKNFINFNK